MRFGHIWPYPSPHLATLSHTKAPSERAGPASERSLFPYSMSVSITLLSMYIRWFPNNMVCAGGSPGRSPGGAACGSVPA